MKNEIKGHVIDLDGIPLEVWLCGENEHVVLLYETAQVADFPFGQPGNYEIEQLAQRVAAGEAKSLACMGSRTGRAPTCDELDDGEVIDIHDDFTTNRTRQGNETLH